MDIPEILIFVDNPQITNNILKRDFILRVHTKTSRPEFDRSEFSVYRHYNDFILLRETFIQKFPCLILPPLMENNVILLLNMIHDVKASEWMKQRLYCLNFFLKALSTHPLLYKEQLFIHFLTYKMTNELEGKESLNSLSPLDSTLSTSKDSGLIKENPDVQKAIITLAETHVLNYNDSLNQLFASDQDANPNPSTLRDSNYLLRRLNKTLKQSSTALILKGRSTEFQEAIQYSTNFRDICRRLDKVGEHIWSEFTSYNKIQRSYIAFQDSTWLNFEISLTDLIKRETQCNSRLAQTLDEWLPRYKNSHLFIKNYALYYDSLREGMCNRDEFQVELELTKDEYEARKREIAKKMGNYARNQRLKDLLSGLNFKTLLNKCDNCDNNVSNNNTDSKADSNDGICKESAEYKNGVKSINMGHDKLSGDKNIDALRAAERDSMILKDFNRARSQMHMSALEREIERNQLASAKADSQFLEDFKVFRCNLVKDMKAYFVDLADLYIDLYSQNVNAWEACVEEEAAHSILNKN